MNIDRDFTSIVLDLLGPRISEKNPDFLPQRITRTARVERRTGGFIKLAFESSEGVANFLDYLEDYKNDNDDINLEFDPALLDFEPSDALLKKSKNPLWIIKPIDKTTVIIERVWG